MDDDRKERLRVYRSHNVQRAIFRDNDRCVICHFLHKRYRKSAEVHHVYGRGRDEGDWREHYSSLMCVCKTCHPQPIKHKPAGASLVYVERIADQMNETPINPEFTHDG